MKRAGYLYTSTSAMKVGARDTRFRPLIQKLRRAAVSEALAGVEAKLHAILRPSRKRPCGMFARTIMPRKLQEGVIRTGLKLLPKVRSSLKGRAVQCCLSAPLVEDGEQKHTKVKCGKHTGGCPGCTRSLVRAARGCFQVSCRVLGPQKEEWAWMRSAPHAAFASPRRSQHAGSIGVR